MTGPEIIPRAIRLTEVAFGLEYRDWLMLRRRSHETLTFGYECRACANGYPRWYATADAAEQAARDHERQVIHHMRERERRRAWEIVTALLPILAAMPAPRTCRENADA